MKLNISLLITNFLFTLILLKTHAPLLLIKLSCIIFLLIVIYVLRIYPLFLLKRLSYARYIRHRFPEQFILRTTRDFIRNMAILSIYILFFVVFILILRILRSTQTLDINNILEKLLNYIYQTSSVEFLIDLGLILLCVLVYRKILWIIQRLYRRELIKLHLFFSGKATYVHKIIFISMHLKLSSIVSKIKNILFWVFYYTGLKPIEVYSIEEPFSSIKKLRIEKATYLFVDFVIPNLHYVTILCCVCYDTLSGVLSLFYKGMIFFFIYNIYIRMSNCMFTLNLTNDGLLHELLYEPITNYSETDCFVGEKLLNKADCIRIIKGYAYTGLVDPYMLSLVKPSRYSATRIQRSFNKLTVYININNNYFKWITFIIFVITVIDLL